MKDSQLSILNHVSLASFTTLGVGGPARFFCVVRELEELREALEFARSRGVPAFILGGGSNLLVRDSGFDGLVIHMQLVSPVEIQEEEKGLSFCVPAGMVWDEFVRLTCERGVSGVECLAGIPGLVGGTPVQNVGAYGQEVADTLQSVSALDRTTLEVVVLGREECGFAYRRSIFNGAQKGRYVIVQVTFRFDPAARPSIRYADLAKRFEGRPLPSPLELSEAVREIRYRKGMLIVEGEADSRSAGSFFKNPVMPSQAFADLADSLNVEPREIPHWPAEEGIKVSAAWLLERAGFYKGFSMGRAGISSRHSLALINLGGAAAGEIVALRDAIVSEVKRRFGILLEQEPVEVGS